MRVCWIIKKQNIILIYYRKYLEQIISENPDHAVNNISLGVIFGHLGQNKLALSAAARGISIDSTQYLKMAEFYSVMGNFDESMISLENALANGYRDVVWIRLNPDLELLQRNKKFYGPFSENICNQAI